MKKRKGYKGNSGIEGNVSDLKVTEVSAQEFDVPEVASAQRSIVSQELLEAFERFYEYHPARRLSRNLRSLLLEFLMYDGSAEAEYLRDLMIDLDGFFTLLDAMEEENERISKAS